MPSTNLWERFKALFTKKPDARPDPEDKDAYDHFDKVAAKMALRAKPVQLLRDRTKKPTDVTEGWDDVALEAPKAGMDCWVDVYDGPRGSGYQVNYEMKRASKTIRKIVNFGPEEERERDWYEHEETGPVV